MHGRVHKGVEAYRGRNKYYRIPLGSLYNNHTIKTPKAQNLILIIQAPYMRPKLSYADSGSQGFKPHLRKSAIARAVLPDTALAQSSLAELPLVAEPAKGVQGSP